MIEAAKLALEALNKNEGEFRIEGASLILRTAIEAAEKQEPTGKQSLQVEQEQVAWTELCRRLYIELWNCDQQMTHTYDEEGEQMWRTGKTVSDVLRDAGAALDATPPAAPVQEPVGALILGGVIDTSDGPEYEEWDVEWNTKAVETLQEKLVTSNGVTLMLYTTLPVAAQPASESANEKN